MMVVFETGNRVVLIIFIPWVGTMWTAVTLSVVSLMLPVTAASLNVSASSLTCLSGLRKFDPFRHKTTYRVGVHAIRGFERAREEYNMIFSDYLTATAGQRFSPPIRFEVVPVTFQGLLDAVDRDEIDFFHASPGIYSCVGVELGAQPLATIIARLETRGSVYDLDVYGGVMFTKRDSLEINTLQDLRGKVIAAGGISEVLSGQVQFYEMEKAGMSYVMDPAQVVFTHNLVDVVKGVLSGEFDVGFVRTGTIERTRDENGDLVDPDDFKILNPKIFVMDNGNLFPFLHSTDIYPEWPFASLNHVPSDVSLEVQQALLASGSHAEIGAAYEQCKAEMPRPYCDTLPPSFFDSNVRCDTTRELAELAWEASKVGKFAGFRTARSYFEPRTMHEAAGFMLQDDNGDWRCTRSATLYNGIRCPAGHVKRSVEEFQDGCNQVGLDCKEGYNCFCRPCVFEVDLYKFMEGEDDKHLNASLFTEYPGGCQRLDICGSVQQTKQITFRAYDNMEREDPFVRVVLQNGPIARDIKVSRLPGTFVYEFSVQENEAGDVLLEVYFDNRRIPASPVVVEIIERQCGDDRVPNDNGACVCDSGTLEMLNRCVSSTAFFVSLSAVIMLVALSAGLWYMDHKRKQSDQIWHIAEEELQFDNPPEVIGQGGFGVVLLAEYRGTMVAIKRVLPPSDRIRGSKSLHGDSSESPAGSSGGTKPTDAQSESDVRSSVSSGASPIPEDEISRSKRVRLVQPEEESGNKVDTSISVTDFLKKMKQRSMRKTKWLPRWNRAEDLESGISSILDSSGFGEKTSAMPGLCSWFGKEARQRKAFVEEMRLLARLRHPNITTIMGAVVSHEPMLVMEYLEYGSLHDLLRNETMYAGGEIILQIVRNISSGIRFLHANKPPILHGDLKAKNIMVDSRFRAKVGDFGLSSKKKHGMSGTAFWLAPEYLRGEEYTTACDIYSVGIILYEIYSRKNPYEGENPGKVLMDVCNPRINKRPGVPRTCPPKMASIMKKCWSAKPWLRPQAKDLDSLLLDLTVPEAEPLSNEEQPLKKRPTEDMMYKLFPKHIADALKVGREVEPESHDMVTIFFSDIVQFTAISQTVSALKVSNLLDRLYMLFDSLSTKHGVFKVETIGDAYMGVTNLNGQQPTDHAKRIAEFAMDAVEAASNVKIDEDDPDSSCIRIRVGFHSGPVVSNVIGSLNPRYGLFGDTVNTAARMESNSGSGRIHCSERSAMLLAEQAPEIRVEKRGNIDVKGKGKMCTYWVLPKPETSRADEKN